MQDQEGEKTLCRHRLALITSVLKHTSLLSCYLASSGQDGQERQDLLNKSIAELLVGVLDCAEAADRADGGHISSACWSDVVAATQPYLTRCSPEHTKPMTLAIWLLR